LPLDQAIERVGVEMKSAPLLAEELRLTAAEYQAGVPLGQALQRMGARVRLDDLAAMCSMLAQAAALGAPIAQTLAEYALASRRHRMAFLEERAGQAATRLTLPVALFLLPAAMLIVLGPALLNLASAFD
jgi:tight adherence protein C